VGDSQAYKNQGLHHIKLVTQSTILTNTVTSGLLAANYSVGASNIPTFSTRFASTFDEYRIIKANVRVRPVSAGSGVSRFFFNEESTSNPNATDAADRVGWELSNSNANSSSTRDFKWSPRDIDDLVFTSTGTLVNPVYFKIYTDNATYGAPIVATQLWVISAELTVEFRGLK
jgi:hypothetical protein